MRDWLMKLLSLWIVATGLGALLLPAAGCSRMLGEGATIDDQLRLYDGLASIAQKYNATFNATAHVGGSPEAYAKTAFGLNTTLSGQASLTLTADDPNQVGPPAPPVGLTPTTGDQ